MLRFSLEVGHFAPDYYSPEYFTTSFSHLPDELEDRIGEAGLRQKGQFSVQGLDEYAKDLDDRMSDPLRREQLLDLIRLVEEM